MLYSRARTRCSFIGRRLRILSGVIRSRGCVGPGGACLGLRLLLARGERERDNLECDTHRDEDNTGADGDWAAPMPAVPTMMAMLPTSPAPMRAVR